MRILITLLALIVPAISFAQENNTTVDARKFKTIGSSLFDCIYEYKIETKTADGDEITETYNTILQVGTHVSKFWDYTAFSYDSVAYVEKNVTQDIKTEYKNSMLRQHYVFDPIIFQNLPKGKMTVQDIITPNFFAYTEPRDDFNWQLQQDTLTVAENLCYKATTTYGGRDWIVWYSPSIPSSHGPWKFSNLPGLILQAEDSQGTHTFKAIAIRQNSLPIYTDKSIQHVKTSRKAFIKNKNEFEKNPMGNVPVESVSTMSVTRVGDGPNDKIALINGVPLRIRPNGYTPLEIK